MKTARVNETDSTDSLELTRREVLVEIARLSMGPEDIFKDSELLQCPHVKAALETRDREIAELKGGGGNSFLERVQKNPLLRE